ncbi:hypothetical protein [Burkholderia anthina]|uniref:hypothetical protein n=1 Tax=Burkholderia anthina TaxID=179879 RepID=UPI001AA03C66|nr:hypothetical protein [Burkholderia anthina]QTD88764.1 hypothetical protein J4G50_13135 [Burkholderia anthina]
MRSISALVSMCLSVWCDCPQGVRYHLDATPEPEGTRYHLVASATVNRNRPSERVVDLRGIGPGAFGRREVSDAIGAAPRAIGVVQIDAVERGHVVRIGARFDDAVIDEHHAADLDSVECVRAVPTNEPAGIAAFLYVADGRTDAIVVDIAEIDLLHGRFSCSGRGWLGEIRVLGVVDLVRDPAAVSGVEIAVLIERSARTVHVEQFASAGRSDPEALQVDLLFHVVLL